jgi:hypothetical protein
MALSELGQHERAAAAFAAVQGLARPHFSFDDVGLGHMVGRQLMTLSNNILVCRSRVGGAFGSRASSAH